MSAVLSVDGLVVQVQRGGLAANAVTDVSFTVERGGSLGLVGESGCGKSLTLRAVLGLVPPGVERVGGTVTTAEGSRVAMIFQEPLTSLNPTRRVGATVAEGARARGMAKKAAREHAVDLLAEVGVPDARRRAHQYPHELSGGLRQRAMIAMALATEPAVLLCDEPTTALDVSVQDQILGLIDRLRAERGLAVVFVTHDLAVVGDVCDRIAVMYAGQIVEHGTVEEVFSGPRHPYTRALLDASLSVGAATRSFTTISGQPPDPSAFGVGCRFADRCPHVQPACRTAPYALTATPTGHATACVRIGELVP